MITINLLPDEFKIKEKKETRLPVTQAAIVGVSLMVIVSLFLYVDFLFSTIHLKGFEKAWVKKQPDFQQLSALRNEVDGGLKQEKDFMDRFVTTQRPLTLILMWTSEMLPEGAWLTEFKLERKEQEARLFLKGLALPSKEKSSIEQIELYLQNLKSKMPDAALSLTTARQTYEEVSLTQFIANFSWKEAQIK